MNENEEPPKIFPVKGGFEHTLKVYHNYMFGTK